MPWDCLGPWLNWFYCCICFAWFLLGHSRPFLPSQVSLYWSILQFCWNSKKGVPKSPGTDSLEGICLANVAMAGWKSHPQGEKLEPAEPGCTNASTCGSPGRMKAPCERFQILQQTDPHSLKYIYIYMFVEIQYIYIYKCIYFWVGLAGRGWKLKKKNILYLPPSLTKKHVNWNCRKSVSELVGFGRLCLKKVWRIDRNPPRMDAWYWHWHTLFDCCCHTFFKVPPFLQFVCVF